MLSINAEHVLRLPELARKENAKPHNDPFDRILICQAAEENMRLVTHYALIGDYTEPSVLLV